MFSRNNVSRKGRKDGSQQDKESRIWTLGVLEDVLYFYVLSLRMYCTFTYHTWGCERFMVLYCVVFVCIIIMGVGTVVRCMYYIILMFVQCTACIQCNMCTIHVAFYKYVYDTVWNILEDVSALAQISFWEAETAKRMRPFTGSLWKLEDANGREMSRHDQLPHLFWSWHDFHCRHFSVQKISSWWANEHNWSTSWRLFKLA